MGRHAGTRDRRRRAARLAYASGALLVLTGTTGSGLLWQVLLGLVAEAFPAPFRKAFAFVGLVLAVLAGLGGFTVAAGGWIVEHRSRRLGAFLIGLGAGAGLLGLLFNVLYLLAARGDVLGYLLGFALSLGGLGVALAVAARTMAAPLPGRGVVRRVRRLAR